MFLGRFYYCRSPESPKFLLSITDESSQVHVERYHFPDFHNQHRLLNSHADCVSLVREQQNQYHCVANLYAANLDLWRANLNLAEPLANFYLCTTDYRMHI